MAGLLIEENFQHLDGVEVEELIEAFEDLGLSAEPTGPRGTQPRHGWVLQLHLLREDATLLTQEFLSGPLADAVRGVLLRQHAVGVGGTSVRERTLPLRVEIRGRDGRALATVPLGGGR
ncbi:hypothetical protein [Streptacidiphilus melanogenes]|uniref:hypothetical protein n=1 Tax=Streptacidiphilus melanogenes TaxID=411235 RepID=UPI0005AB221B|nr:hypothetical protein [Streptacidiphilus melanogenes]